MAMITCPWCGTNYQTFQSNCKNCGGPLPAPGSVPASPAAGAPTPPPAPRPVADSYLWRLMWADGVAVVGFIIGLIGGIFALTGAGLTLGIITAFVGIPFLLLGLAMLLAGGAVAYGRYDAARRTLNVLRQGQATAGSIARVEQNFNVRVNGRNPFVIIYQFRVQDQGYEGRVSTFNPPGPELQAGQPAWILFLPGSPQYSSLYPHP